ncbi:MAG: YczE/YyaS/YitT family protein [Bacilli bacterium]
MMKNIVQLISGLMLFSLGIVMTIQGNIGFSPWDVFHDGLSHVLPISIGGAAIGSGLIIVCLNVLLGERIGVGTICNVVFIGLFMDLILYVNIIPSANNIVTGVIQCTVGMVIIGIGSVLYLGVGWGAGPRDGLMIAIAKRSKLSVGVVRSGIEVSVLCIGFLLGGNAGLGTLFMSLVIGSIIATVFRVMGFSVQRIEHTYLSIR